VAKVSKARNVTASIAGSWATGQLDSFTPTIRAAELTYTIWPWIPKQIRTGRLG
jgi:hypothetical protein